jgi:hypothetical protein
MHPTFRLKCIFSKCHATSCERTSTCLPGRTALETWLRPLPLTQIAPAACPTVQLPSMVAARDILAPPTYFQCHLPASPAHEPVARACLHQVEGRGLTRFKLTPAATSSEPLSNAASGSSGQHQQPTAMTCLMTTQLDVKWMLSLPVHGCCIQCVCMHKNVQHSWCQPLLADTDSGGTAILQ